MLETGVRTAKTISESFHLYTCFQLIEIIVWPTFELQFTASWCTPNLVKVLINRGIAHVMNMHKLSY